MTPDHEIDWTAAGKLAENWARLCYPETPEGNLSRAYLDAMARLDKAEKAGESWKDAYFKLIRAIGSSPNCSKSPVSIAQELLAQRDEATELLERAYWLVEHFETATYDTKSDWGRLVRAFLAKHRKIGASK